MRSTLLLVTASLVLAPACSSSSSSSSTGEDASVLPAEDASTVPCTSAGGTCVPYTTSCPVLQQNVTLCGNSVLICCLPPEDAAPIVAPPVDSGTGPTDAATEAAGD